MIERPRVAVLLCTYNGGRYLVPQLDSVAAQDIGYCSVHVSDDGSSDDTLQLLHQRQAEQSNGDLKLRRGPGKGHAANFLSLLCAPDITGDYFAFADQDDLWDSDKLSRAVEALERYPPDVPALYCSRTRFISGEGREDGDLSPLFTRPPAFANALIQNIAGGNTMVMNLSARDLLRRVGPVDVVSHDWWTYLLISGAGGQVIYDLLPGLSYRQHRNNAIGGNMGMLDRLKRYYGFLSGQNRAWNGRNLGSLLSCKELLTPENRTVLAEFQVMRENGPIARVGALRRGGLYTQTLSGNLGLFLATLLKKI